MPSPPLKETFFSTDIFYLYKKTLNFKLKRNQCRISLVLLKFEIFYDMIFMLKIKITGITSNDFNFNKYYPDHDPEQHSRSSAVVRYLSNAKAGGTVTFKSYNSKNS